MNSKQVLAAASIIVLVVILAYPALTTGTVSIQVRAMKIESAEHVFVTVNSVWFHQRAESTSAGWKLVSNKSQTLDLISLENSSKALASEQVSVANFDSIRLDVSNVTWVFNKTTTSLSVSSANLDASLDFTVGSGQSLSITVILGGHQEVLGSSKVFVGSVNATLT